MQNIAVQVCSVASVMSDSLQPREPQPTKILCPWGFSSEKHWSGFSCPPSEDLHDPEIETTSLTSPAVAREFFTTSAIWKALVAKEYKVFKILTITMEFLLNAQLCTYIPILSNSSQLLCTHSCICFLLLLRQFSSVAQSYPTLCDPLDCSTPGFPVHHQLAFAQIHVHRVGDAIQPTISSSVISFSSCL